jgi:hypothetical protein
MRIWAILLLLVSWTPCWAEVFIEKPNRVPNRGYGVCAWCAIEMAGRQGSIGAVKGLAQYRDKESKRLIKQAHYTWNPGGGWTYDWVEIEQRNNGGTIARMREQLDNLKVRYISQPEGTKNNHIIYEGTKSGATGCVVGLFNYAYTFTNKKEDGCYMYQQPGPSRSLGYHAVLVTYFDTKVVKFIDPNDIRDPWIVNRNWFDEHWDGSGMIIPPVHHESDTAIVKVESKPPHPLPVTSDKTTKPLEDHPRWVQVLIQSGMSEKDAILTWNRMQGKEN